MYIPEYILLSLYNVACMHIFSVYYLVLDKQSVWFSLGKTISPVLHDLWLPVVFQYRLSNELVPQTLTLLWKKNSWSLLLMYQKCPN